MAGIVHDECALLLVLLHELRHLGIAIARRRRLARVGIPHHFLDEIAGVALVCLDGGIVDVAHVGIAIAVVAHEHEGVLPGAGILVFGIADDLVHHHLCIALRRHGEAADGHIGQSGGSLIGIAAGGKGFAVVEHAEELIADVAVGLAERVVALEAEQVVVGRGLSPVAGEHAVIPCAVAEEQQEAWLVGLGLGTVVEHLQIPLVGGGIGGSAGELVVEFVGRYDAHAQTVMSAVELGQPLGLRTQRLRGRNDDDHVNGAVAMQVLIGDVINVLGYCKLVGAQVGCRLRIGQGQRNEVKSHGTARQSGNGDIIRGLYVGDVEHAIGGMSLFVIGLRDVDGDGSEILPVALHADSTVDACRHGHGKFRCSARHSR